MRTFGRKGSIEGTILATIAIPLFLIGGTLLLNRQKSAMNGEDGLDAATNGIYRVPVVSILAGTEEVSANAEINMRGAASLINGESGLNAVVQLFRFTPPSTFENLGAIQGDGGAPPAEFTDNAPTPACAGKLAQLGSVSEKIRYFVTATYIEQPTICAVNYGAMDSGPPAAVNTVEPSSTTTSSTNSSGGGGCQYEPCCSDLGPGNASFGITPRNKLPPGIILVRCLCNPEC